MICLQAFVKRSDNNALFEIDRFRFNAGSKDSDLDPKSGQRNGKQPARQTTGQPAPYPAGGRERFRGMDTQVNCNRLRSPAPSMKPRLDSSEISLSAKATSALPSSNVKQRAVHLRVRYSFVWISSVCLLTSVDWSDDDEVEENCTFICRSVVVSYKPQLPDGTLGGTISGFFSSLGSEQQRRLRMTETCKSEYNGDDHACSGCFWCHPGVHLRSGTVDADGAAGQSRRLFEDAGGEHHGLCASGQHRAVRDVHQSRPIHRSPRRRLRQWAC